MAGGVGHTGGLKKTAPDAEDAEPVILIPVGLPCFKRGRPLQKNDVKQNITGHFTNRNFGPKFLVSRNSRPV